MLANKTLAADLQIGLGILRLAELKNDKLTAERMAALFSTSALIRGYQKEFNNIPLALDICARKIEFILQAQTKEDLKEILYSPRVRYNGNEVVPVGRYHIEEEELLIWSLTSLWSGGPLLDMGYKRYIKLFVKFFPDIAKEIGIE